MKSSWNHNTVQMFAIVFSATLLLLSGLSLGINSCGQDPSKQLMETLAGAQAQDLLHRMSPEAYSVFEQDYGRWLRCMRGRQISYFKRKRAAHLYHRSYIWWPFEQEPQVGMRK